MITCTLSMPVDREYHALLNGSVDIILPLEDATETDGGA